MDARSNLVAAALKLLEESGESGFSTRAACAIAGVTAPTLYHHFGTADGLLSAAIEAAFAAFLKSKQNQAGERDPIRALKGGWDDYVAFAAARPRLYAAMFARVLQGADIPAARQSRGILEDRLARIDAPLPEGAQGMPGVIVPRKTVNELRKLLDDDDAKIAVSVSETKVRFATPAITLTSKVIDGTFPDYSRVIPTGNNRRLEVDAAEFAKAVDRVATVSSERSRAVKMQLDEDRLVLSVNAPDSGAAEEELAVAYGDERLEIGFNAKYLLEIASQVDRENAVFLFNSSGDPTLMREGNDASAVYVVMPMRV